MSGPAEQWAWQLQDERLSLSEKFVLVYLARRAYYDDGCGAWPSVNTIAAHCHCTRRSVLRALKRLQELGYLREGDQELAARNPRSHEPIPRGHRSKVWDVVMKGARTEPEDITDPGETSAGKGVPAKPSAAGPSRSKECARGDMVSPDAVSPDTMSLQGDSDGGVTSCPKRGDVMSPNRQVITNAPLVPYGDIPLAGEQPEEERSEHDAPDWRLALPPRGVRDPLWTPGAEDADERVRSRALQEVRVLTLIHDRVAAIDPKAARPASMRDRRKVHELLMERSLTEVETILDWAYGNPRWISWLVDGTMVERYFAQVSLDMRTKRARGPQHSGSHAAAAELTPVHDPDRPVAVSSGLAWRVPVYGGGILSIALCQAHLDGETKQAECPVCAYDRRNQASHAIGLEKTGRAEDKESHGEARP